LLTTIIWKISKLVIRTSWLITFKDISFHTNKINDYFTMSGLLLKTNTSTRRAAIPPTPYKGGGSIGTGLPQPFRPEGKGSPLRGALTMGEKWFSALPLTVTNKLNKDLATTNGTCAIQKFVAHYHAKIKIDKHAADPDYVPLSCRVNTNADGVSKAAKATKEWRLINADAIERRDVARATLSPIASNCANLDLQIKHIEFMHATCDALRNTAAGISAFYRYLQGNNDEAKLVAYFFACYKTSIETTFGIPMFKWVEAYEVAHDIKFPKVRVKGVDFLALIAEEKAKAAEADKAAEKAPTFLTLARERELAAKQMEQEKQKEQQKSTTTTPKSNLPLPLPPAAVSLPRPPPGNPARFDETDVTSSKESTEGGNREETDVQVVEAQVVDKSQEPTDGDPEVEIVEVSAAVEPEKAAGSEKSQSATEDKATEDETPETEKEASKSVSEASKSVSEDKETEEEASKSVSEDKAAEKSEDTMSEDDDDEDSRFSVQEAKELFPHDSADKPEWVTTLAEVNTALALLGEENSLARKGGGGEDALAIRGGGDGDDDAVATNKEDINIEKCTIPPVMPMDEGKQPPQQLLGGIKVLAIYMSTVIINPIKFFVDQNELNTAIGRMQQATKTGVKEKVAKKTIEILQEEAPAEMSLIKAIISKEVKTRVEGKKKTSSKAAASERKRKLEAEKKDPAEKKDSAKKQKTQQGATNSKSTSKNEFRGGQKKKHQPATSTKKKPDGGKGGNGRKSSQKSLKNSKKKSTGKGTRNACRK